MAEVSVHHGQKNAFDLLRLLLAASVLVSHGLLIGGYNLVDPLAVLSKNQTYFAEVGVMGFFTLSGYLITASFERTGNIFVFASHRLSRILPGFWMCLLVTAFILAPVIYSFHGRQIGTFKFTGVESSVGYVLHNLFLKVGQWSIRDVLTFAAYKDSLNGSLWSLYPEMQCYCFTALAGISGLFNKNKNLYFITAIAVFSYFAISFNFSKTYGPTLLILSPALKLYTSYIAGSLIFTFRDKLLFDIKGTIFLSIFTLTLIKFGGFHLLSPFLIALTLINVFQLFECKIKYDVSYGVYIFAFPIQQLLFQLFGNRLPAVAFIFLSLLAAMLMGFLSYILIERPFINLRKKFDPALKRLAPGLAKQQL